MYLFRNKASFYCEELLAHTPTTKLDDRTWSAVLDTLFNIFAATVHTGGCSSIHNLKTRHNVMTGAHFLSRVMYLFISKTYSQTSAKI
jgi:hypothetical protein